MGTIGLWLFAVLVIWAVLDTLTYLFVPRDAPSGGGTSA